METANVLHNYLLKVGQGRRIEFRPQPTIPKFVVGKWAAGGFKDASKNSGQEIYNREIVRGAGPAGEPIKVNRYAGQQPGVLGVRMGPTNGSFDTDLSGWTAIGLSSPVRTTTPGQFNTAPAAMKLSLPSVGAYTDVSGTFKRGHVYRLSFSMDASLPTGGAVLRVLFGGGFDAAGNGGDKTAAEWGVEVTGVWFERQLVWVPESDFATARIWLMVAAADEDIYVDDFELEALKPTLPDRRGFIRSHTTSMSSAITPEVGQQIADTFLATHKRTPLKGDITVRKGDLRRWLGGATVHPSELLLHTGELIHLADQIDPDTGALGRDAPIDSVTYNDDDETATVSLGAQRDNLAALIARYEAVVGGGGG